MQITLTTIKGVTLGTIESPIIPNKGSTILIKSGEYKVIKLDSKSTNKSLNLIVDKVILKS